jgi:hypothetical protein
MLQNKELHRKYLADLTSNVTDLTDLTLSVLTNDEAVICFCFNEAYILLKQCSLKQMQGNINQAFKKWSFSNHPDHCRGEDSDGKFARISGIKELLLINQIQFSGAKFDVRILSCVAPARGFPGSEENISKPCAGAYSGIWSCHKMYRSIQKENSEPWCRAAGERLTRTGSNCPG